MFSGSCLLCNIFLKDDSSWKMNYWYFIRANWYCIVKVAEFKWFDSMPHHRSGYPCCAGKHDLSPSFANSWPQRCLGNNTVNAHKVNTCCLFLSTFLNQCPYVLQSQHLYAIPCVVHANLNPPWNNIQGKKKESGFMISQTINAENLIWYVQCGIHY